MARLLTVSRSIICVREGGSAKPTLDAELQMQIPLPPKADQRQTMSVLGGRGLHGGVLHGEGSAWKGVCMEGVCMEGVCMEGGLHGGVLHGEGSAWRGSAWRGLHGRGSAWRGSAWRGICMERGSAWRGSAWRGICMEGSAWRGSAWKGGGAFCMEGQTPSPTICNPVVSTDPTGMHSCFGTAFENFVMILREM